jgi:SAM-dependent methyltransferase
MSATKSSVSEMPLPDLVVGNHFDKYATRNPIARWLVNGFLQNVRTAITCAQPESVLDVGCADGRLASLVIAPELAPSYLGIDISPAQVAKAAVSYSHLQFRAASAYSLPVSANSVDLALALEIFEHLERPHEAMAELARVTRRWALVSVPWEPWWRALNVARGAYLSQWGNTPGHIQHFTRRAVRSIAERNFRIVREFRPLPWTMLLLEKR